MKRTHRLPSSKSKLTSLAICYCLILAIAAPFGTTNAAAKSRSLNSSSLSSRIRLSVVSTKVLALSWPFGRVVDH